MSLVGNGIKSKKTGKSCITTASTSSIFKDIGKIKKDNFKKGTLSTGPVFSVK